MAENFVGEENLEISSNQQKGKVDSPIHCLNLGASNIILVGGTTYHSGNLLILHLSNVFGKDEFNINKRCMPPLL
mgnify:CR=1 FL=1